MTEDKKPVELRNDQAAKFLCRLFELAGAEPGTARTISDALIEAELEGNASHGLLQAPVYVRRLLAGTISGTARLKEIHRNGAVSVFDAGLGLGHAAAGQLAALAASDARKHGVAAATVRSATHFGVAGRYARMLAEAGLIGIVMCNSRAMMPGPGGREPVVGNNPLAIAVPCAGQPPIVFDMAMSAAAMGRIRQAAQKGEAIPLGWAVDAEGRDTTDAEAAIRGLLLPAAGPKGFGLALMVDLLCALSGGTAGTELGSLYAPPEEKADCSWLFIAIDPAQFGLAMPYAERVAKLAETVRRTAPDPSFALPGDRKRAAAAKAGGSFKLAPAVAADLDALSRQLGGLDLSGTGK